MARTWAVLLFAWICASAETPYEIRGRLDPPLPASIALHAVSTPFKAQSTADDSGRFRIKKIPAGNYTILIWVPGRGEAHKTIDVGPGRADKRGRVELVLGLSDSDFEFTDSSRRMHTVSAAQLAIPAKAVREYQNAQRDFLRGAIEEGTKHMEKAVSIAPNYSGAWNDLGTIRYKKGEYAEAEQCFRRSLDADPEAYWPLVNLGGVLLNLGRLQDALAFNLRAVSARPNDPLGNAQLGQSYFRLQDLKNAAKYLETAIRLDPGHFSYPQLILAGIYSQWGDRAQASEQLSSFLKLHPDYPKAEELKAVIERLRE